MSYVVVAYFTVGTLYEIEAKRLIASLMRFDIPYFIKPIEDNGNWYLNTQYKPQFLREMLDMFPEKSIIYVDIDAEFCQVPELFNSLHIRPEVNIGVHLLDHKKRGRNAGFEMLSGTIFLKNNTFVRDIIDKWILECGKGDKIWDQSALNAVLQGIPFQILPEEYCTIFDYMKDVANPVIKHYQASRQVSMKMEKIPKLLDDVLNPEIGKSFKPDIVKTPRKIGKGGLVRYRRTWRNV